MRHGHFHHMLVTILCHQHCIRILLPMSWIWSRACLSNCHLVGMAEFKHEPLHICRVLKGFFQVKAFFVHTVWNVKDFPRLSVMEMRKFYSHRKRIREIAHFISVFQNVLISRNFCEKIVKLEISTHFFVKSILRFKFLKTDFTKNCE